MSSWCAFARELRLTDATHLQWFLELWDASHAVLGVIAIIAIQRAIQKILISVFLSRELKHEETNRAWWSGKWYGRGLGSSAFSQPAREFVVKIVEMSLWTSDFLLAHLLLIVMTVPMFIPFVDRLHSTMLCKFLLSLLWCAGGRDAHGCVLAFQSGCGRRSRSARRSSRRSRSASGGGLFSSTRWSTSS